MRGLQLVSRDPREDPRKAKMVADVRSRWERRDGNRRGHSQSRIQLTFDEMLDAFLSDCTRFSHIAVACDVSRERVRQIYRDYFAVLIGRKGGRARQKVCTIVNRKVIRESLVRDFSTLQRRTREAAERAIKAGHDVVTVLNRTGLSVAKNRLTINGKQVIVQVSERSFFCSDRALTPHFRIAARSKADFHVMWCGAPLNSFFVFQQSLIPVRTKDKYMYVPEHPCDYIPSMGITDWVWEHKEAWELLR